MPYYRNPYEDFPTAPPVKEHFDQVKDSEPPNNGSSGTQKSVSEIEAELEMYRNQRSEPELGLHFRPDGSIVGEVHKEVENENEKQINFLEELLDNMQNEPEQDISLDSSEFDESEPDEPEID